MSGNHTLADSGAPGAQDTWTELLSLLVEQINLAKIGKTAELPPHMARTEELLTRATDRPPERIEREVRRLYHELCLTLAAEKSALAGRLKQVRTGKNCLHAYGGR
jgi:hypothetical protein